MESNDMYQMVAQALFGDDWISWNGLPCNMTYEMLIKEQGSTVTSKGIDLLGKRELQYALLQWPHSENLVRVWLNGDIIEAIDTPGISRPAPITKAIGSLGEPDVQFDYYFNVLKITGGERVYASRGLTLFTDKDAERVHHVLVYPATNSNNYVNYYRLHFPPMRRHRLVI